MERTDGSEGNGRPLRILICLLYYFPHRTGLTIHVQRLAAALVRRGHRVTVLTARYRGDLPRDDVTMHEGVRIVRLYAPIRISRGMLMPAYPWAAYKLMKEHDVVNIHTPMLETALVAMLSRMTGRKLVITHHGDLILPAGLMNAFIRRTMFAMYKVAARRAARILAYTEDYANHSYYLAPFMDKVTANLPPVQMPVPNPERVREWRTRWRGNDGPLVGFAHRFVEEKRPDLAIRSLEVVSRKYPGARLVFAGEHRIRYEQTWQRLQPLVARFRDRLVFVGLLEQPQDMADFYAACDVLALTSDSDCFSLALVESMLCGTPVVATDIPGVRIPVRASGMGKLAAKGDHRSIGESLIEVLDDPGAFFKPRAAIEKIFSFEHTIDTYERCFYAHARRG